MQAVLFDLGGTLDGDGLHWLDRFFQVYHSAHVKLTWTEMRRAFDFAEATALDEAAMQNASLREMVKCHVRSQFCALHISDTELEQQIADAFTSELRRTAAANVPVLAELANQGLKLGVISNGCGNTAVLCDELGFLPVLQCVLDSRCVGLSKPDRSFFERAAAELKLPATEILMVGDSLERDIRPAKQLGMQTAWVNRDPAAADPAADFRIGSIAELPALLTPTATAR